MRFKTNCTIALGLLLLAALPGVGQELHYRSLLRFQVKPGMMSDFEAAVKADKEAMTKAGYKRAQTWWRALTGDSEVVLVRYYANFADMDTREKPDVGVSLARARVMHCVSATETILDEVIPEASTGGAGKPLPNYVRVLRATVKPDQMAAFEKLLKEDVGPAVKKANVPWYVATKVRFGKTMNLFLSISGLDSIARLDEVLPVEKAMGKPAYDALMTKYAAMATHSETVLYRAMPELNYLPQQ